MCGAPGLVEMALSEVASNLRRPVTRSAER